MKVYDCFTFFNELDLLEIRLNELNDVVDYFVLVESKKSWQNNSKDCYYLSNIDRFKQFEHKIIRLEIPENQFGNNAWDNERHSFNYLINGLSNANDDDIIMLSCLDEIPKKQIVEFVKNNNEYPCCALNKFYYFYLNTKYSYNFGNVDWLGTYFTKFANLDKNNIYQFVKIRKDVKLIPDAGWHFSFLGDANNAYLKVNSYSHSEYNHFSKEFYQERINNLEDPFSRNNEQKFYGLELLQNLPKYVQNNIEKFERYIRK